MSSEEIKKCPYCAETIKKEAVICRFCGYDLKTGKSVISSISIDAKAHKTVNKIGLKRLGRGPFFVEECYGSDKMP